MSKHVLTGGPGIGKTTLIELLAARGFTIVPEAARLIIEEEKVKDSDILPWKNLTKFQEKVAKLQLELEERAKGKIVFLDRSLIDGYGYCILENVPAPTIIEKVARNRYDKVFLLDPLLSYKNDHSRLEDKNKAEAIHETIAKAYLDFGYSPIKVPVLSPQERVEFILKNLNWTRA